MATSGRDRSSATVWSPDDVTVTDDVLRLVVNDYTREAGVRQLEREIGTRAPEDGGVCRVRWSRSRS